MSVATVDRHPIDRDPAPTDHAADSVREAVGRCRTRLERLGRTRALLLALASGAATVLVGLLVAQSVSRSIATAPVRLTIGVLAVVIALLVHRAVRRRTPAVTLVRAALWLEERTPCAHALVTLVDAEPTALTPEVAERLARLARPALTAAPQALSTVQRRVLRAPALWAIAATLLMVGGIRWSMLSPAMRATSVPGEATEGALARPVASRVTAWRVEITPPAYARQPRQVVDDASTVQALPGSRVQISGAGDATGLSANWLRRDAALANAALAVTDAPAGWVVSFLMPGRAAAVRVADARDRTDRTLTLLPRPDSLPVVQLLTPERDVVQRDSTGVLALTAVTHDDLGLGNVRFELIITSGSGEQYTARTVVLGERTLDGRRRDSVAATTTLEALGMQPGDVVHMRAVARDRHPASDREAGVSETRSLRIARADEYDSVAVDAAPPPAVDSSLLSQRMLLLLTERLEARRPRLERAVLVSESRKLAAEQARIRRAVSGIVFQRLSGDGEAEHVHYEGDGHDHGLVVQAGKLVPSTSGDRPRVMPGATPPPSLVAPIDGAGGESPIVGINRPLLEAYNHMWDAGRALELADPAAAIPPMRLALEAIQRARAAERVYLRGRTRPIVVDLARVRLAGRDTGQASARRSGERLPDRERVWDARLRAAVALLPVNGSAARDSLLTLRLDALETRPDVADAVAKVLERLRTGDDVTDALVRVRRTIAPPTRRDDVPAWGTP